MGGNVRNMDSLESSLCKHSLLMDVIHATPRLQALLLLDICSDS